MMPEGIHLVRTAIEKWQSFMIFESSLGHKGADSYLFLMDMFELRVLHGRDGNLNSILMRICI